MRRALSTALLVAFILGCSSSGTYLSESEKIFVAEMIPHHDLGVKLIDEAMVSSYDVRLRRMVFEMSGYHDSELHQLHVLADGNNIEPARKFPGSISDADIDRLTSLTGLAHDTWWLHVMITHHVGALMIAERVLNADSGKEVATIATSVNTVQSKELSAMRELLGEFCATDASLAGCSV